MKIVHFVYDKLHWASIGPRVLDLHCVAEQYRLWGRSQRGWGVTQVDGKLTLVDWIYTAEKRHEVVYTTGTVEAKT